MARVDPSGIVFASNDVLTSRRQIFPTSTSWIFHQASAPTGWTKSTTDDNKALRLVSGSGGGSAGSTPFTSIMSNFNVGGALGPFSTTVTGNTAVTLAQIPQHNHQGGIGLNAVPASFNPDGGFTGWNGGDVYRAGGYTRNSPNTGDTSPTATRDAVHFHPFSANATVTNQNININVEYIDVIICAFDG